MARSDDELLKQKYRAKDAPAARQEEIVTRHGVRWAASDYLPGWRPATQTALDFMHAILLGTVSVFRW